MTDNGGADDDSVGAVNLTSVLPLIMILPGAGLLAYPNPRPYNNSSFISITMT